MIEMSDIGLSQFLILLLFLLLVYVPQGYSLYMFLCIFFQKKTRIRSILLLISSLLLVKAVLGSYISITEKVLMTILFHFIVLAVCFYGKQAQKLFAAVFYTVFVVSIETIITFLGGYLKFNIQSEHTTELLIINSMQMGLVLLSTLILVRKLYIFRSDSLVTLSSRDWLILSTIPIGSLIILIATFATQARKMFIDNVQIGVQVVVVMLCLLTINITVLYIYQKLLHYINQMARNDVIEKQILEYEKLQQKQRELQYLRHDMKNILLTVRGLMSGDSVLDACKYLDTIIEESFASTGQSTGHAVVDAICNEKIGSAEKHGIEVRKKFFIPQDLALEGKEVGLSLILGNILDNALEGVLRVSEGNERWIDIQMRYHNNTLLIRVINPAENVSTSGVEDFHSSKRKGTLKGSGVDIIKMYVHKLGGTVSLDYSYPYFKVTVLLNIG